MPTADMVHLPTHTYTARAGTTFPKHDFVEVYRINFLVGANYGKINTGGVNPALIICAVAGLLLAGALALRIARALWSSTAPRARSVKQSALAISPYVPDDANADSELEAISSSLELRPLPTREVRSLHGTLTAPAGRRSCR